MGYLNSREKRAEGQNSGANAMRSVGARSVYNDVLLPPGSGIYPGNHEVVGNAADAGASLGMQSGEGVEKRSSKG